MEIQGQDQVTGLPKPASLSTNEIVEAMQPPLDERAHPDTSSKKRLLIGFRHY